MVHTAAKTSEAESVLKQHTDIDVVLLDIILPDESGFDFLERLKSNAVYKHIPVLILSNLGQEHEIERGKKLGAVDFLVKGNYSPQEIAQRVSALLTKAST